MKNTNFKEQFKKVEKYFLEILKYCNVCNVKRKEISFDEFPEFAKKEFKPYKNKATFVYCPHCDEYAMLHRE